MHIGRCVSSWTNKTALLLPAVVASACRPREPEPGGSGPDPAPESFPATAARPHRTFLLPSRLLFWFDGPTTGLAAPPRRIRIRPTRSRSRRLPFTARSARSAPRAPSAPPTAPRPSTLRRFCGRRHGERRRRRASAGGVRAAGACAVPGRRVLRLPGAPPRPSRSISWTVECSSVRCCAHASPFGRRRSSETC